jgi:hypothetical protein
MESSTHLAESSSHLVDYSSHLVEYSNHVAKSSSHLAESYQSYHNQAGFLPVTVGESSFYFTISIETASYLQRLLLFA